MTGIHLEGFALEKRKPTLAGRLIFLLLSKIIKPHGAENFVDSNKPASFRVPLTRSEAEACAALFKAGYSHITKYNDRYFL